MVNVILRVGFEIYSVFGSKKAKNHAYMIFKWSPSVIENKNPKKNDGWTPLHAAAKNGHYQICKIIMNEIKYE